MGDGNMASLDTIYCKKHRKKSENYNQRRTSRRRTSRKWQCSQKAKSGGLYCDKHELAMETCAKRNRKGNPRPNRTLATLLSLSTYSAGRKKGQICRKEASSSGAVERGKEATKRQGGRRRLRDEETVSDDLVSGLGEMVRKKRRGVSVSNDHEEKAASPANDETTSEQNSIDDEENDAVTLPFLADYNTHEELHENGGLSLVTDGAMNAVDFSCEHNVMEVQSAVCVGDFSIPAEYEQIYKEIKDLHGPLENGESVCEERRLSRETLVELLKVAHELGSLTMESMTKTTISDFERTVAIGKLFNYNVGWLDESLERLSDVYAKCCAVDGELKQVDWKITEKKHEEDILKLEVDEIDENIRILEESINKMKKKQEIIEMEKKKKKYSNLSSLQERILEASERICDTSTEFYRIAAQPW